MKKIVMIASVASALAIALPNAAWANPDSGPGADSDPSKVAFSASTTGDADPNAERPVPTIGGKLISGKAEFKITAETIQSARAEAVAQQQGGFTAAESKKANLLIAAAEAEGHELEESDIDVVPLLGGDVTLTVPVDIQIDEVVIKIDAGIVDVSAESSEASTDTPAAGGPGMAPYWAGNGDGHYVLTVRGIGDALFVWQRVKLMNDGNPNYVWYAYKRKGDADPFEVTGPNARVKKLRVQNWPWDSVENSLVNWNEWDPASDFTGQCGGHSYNASISVFGADFNVGFQDCDKYNVWRNASKPSSYWIEMDQGLVLNPGSRHAGYVLAWKQDQGTAGSQHDFQRVVFYYLYENHECSHTDAGDRCN